MLCFTDVSKEQLQAKIFQLEIENAGKFFFRFIIWLTYFNNHFYVIL